MHQSVCVPAVLIALLVLTCSVPRGQSCPRSCNCYQANEVHCTFRSLLNIPPGLPAHTRRINLGFNSINRLHDNSLAGLKRAELLMLHSNDLHHLPDGVFRDMKSLQILKLSYNKLREISSSLTFTGLTSLLRLYLDHNLLQYIHPRALLQLPSLRLLRLQGNRLHQLHPHTLCTLSLLNTYYFSTLRNLDLSNNSLTTLPKDTLAAAPLLETLMLHSNPWSCDCRMNWLLDWSLAHPGLLKCPGGPQCPLCATPSSLQEKGLLEQTSLLCASPGIILPGKETIAEADLSEIQSSETFREPLGSATLSLSDEHGNNVDLSCNITQSSSSQDIAPPPDLTQPSTLPLPLALSLSLECPVERQSYEKLWRILAYYSETAVRLEREIMLSKAPGLAYRYRQTTETDGYYHTGVKASVKARPHWLLQPAISIQLNRAESNAHKVHLKYSTRVSTHPDPASQLSAPFPTSHPWVLILTNHTTTALTAIAGSNVELSCPLVSSGNPKVQWILPDGSRLISPSSSLDGRLQALASSLLLKKVLLSDAGIYYCVVLAVRDVDVLPLRLAVEESSVPPSGEQVGPPVMGTTGELVKLSCKASGSPEPYLSWILPDGNVIRWGLAVSGGLSIDLNGSLVLSRPSLRDAGHYRCTAVNQYGRDSLSMQLILTSGHIPTLRSSSPTGPQSAAGRSTKIRAPLFRDLDEESGDGEEDETAFVNRKHPVSLQPNPNRRYPVGNPRRRGPLRGSATRGGGRPISSTDQRRNRFENRQRIDPQKWADLLAKIRQKTNYSQPITTTAPTVEPVQGSEDRATQGHDEDYDTDEDRTQGASMQAESEESSVDEAVLQEEGLQPVQPVHAQIEPTTKPKTDSETDAGMEESTEEPTVIQIDKGNETETPTGTQITGLQTETPTNSVTQKKAVISNPQPGANEIESPEEEAQTTNSNSSSSRPQTPQHGLPNLVPNSRPQSPWNSRRKIGQRRRIINRPRGRPLTPPQPPLDPVNPRSQAVTPDTTISQLNMLSTATSPAILLTSGDHSGTSINRAALGPKSTSVSNTPHVSTSESSSSSPASSLSLTKTYTDMVTHSSKRSDTEGSNLFNTSAPTHSHNVISKTHVPDTHPGTFTHGIQIHTETQTVSGKHVNRPQDKHSGDRKRNFSDVPHESHSSMTHSFIDFPSSTFISKAVTTSTRFTDSTTHIGISSENIHLKTTSVIVNTTNPTMFTAPPNIIPISTITRQTTTTPITATTHKTTTSVLKSTIPTTTITTTTTTTTATTTTAAANDTSTITHSLRNNADDSTTTRMTTASSDDTGFPNIPFNTASTTTTTTISNKTIPATITTAMSSTSRTTTNTKALSSERVRVDLADPKEKTDSEGPSQSRPPTDWKNPGANSIPDSHRSRSHWSPSSSLAVTPVASAARSRPKISDPHIRTVSFPADGTARLSCEAQGEPKPSITWTKVTTGAVMSIHSRAQRFEVLPNGTLVIQNVQQQDRGTYICSAQNFLGRDRLLTTLEVSTRPPRMKLPSNRESTIHQGGEVNLDCQAEGVPTPLLSWVLPDRSVITSSESSTNRISMDTNGTLHISVTLPSDRGVYRCVASNSAGAASASVRVHVSSLPPVIQQPREEHLLLSPGRPVYAHCSARGAPPPTLRWRIPDGTLVRTSQFLHGNLFVLPNGTLHIRKIGPKDTGSYECSASNAVGADKRTVKVEIKEEGGVKTEVAKTVVTEKPSSSWSPNKDTNLNIPTHHSDPFDSTKFSPPSVHDRSKTFIPSTSHSSFHPHQPSSSNPSKINKASTASPTLFTNIKKTNPSSSFPSSSVPTNNTRVLPSTNNTRVTTSFSADRRITAVLHPLPVSPFTKARIISSSPSISAVQYGGTLQLHCSVNGNPAPIIIWRTPNRKLVDVHLSFDRRMKVHPNGTLSVQSMTEKDAGDYLCIARNKVSDDYRLLRVSVATKPAKIETKQPLNQMVSFGKPLKVDCQASGLPDPAVRWSLPDGTMVNSVLHGEDRGGRARRLTVFDNGTLLVPAVGLREEGEYTCYAENQGGQDSMKVKVKVMMTSPPTFTDNRAYHVLKVHQGTTAKITCQATGDPLPTVTWFSPAHRIIPQSLGSGYYSERVVVVSGGTLEVRQAQKIDTGNYTCRASNTAGGGSMIVSLEVEGPTYGMSGQGGEQGRSSNNGHGSNSDIDSRIINSVPNTGGTSVISSSNPDLRINSQNGFNRPVSGIVTQPGSSVVSVGVSGGGNVDIKTDNTGATRNGAGITSSSNSVANSPSIVRGDGVERNPGTYNNEVIARRGRIDVNTNTAQAWLSGISRNNGGASSSVSDSRGGTSTHRGNGFSGSNNLGGANENTRSRGVLISNMQNFTNTVQGVVTTVKLQAVKGQTVLLPCPSQGSPPPRLAWLLPGNGMLPAPYYGSRLTVHRNGSLELRGVRGSDAGTLVCVVKTEREERTVRVELDVSEPKVEARPPHRGPNVDKPVLKTSGLTAIPQTGGLSDSAVSLNSRPLSPVVPQSRSPVTQKPLQRGSSFPAAPRLVALPPFKGPNSEPAVSTRTAPLVSIINGETLHLPCPASQTHGYSQESLVWTMPSGKVLSRGESSDSGRYSVQEDGTLTVQQTSVFDRGSYTCRSSSSDSSSASVLTVPVIVIAYPPRITTGPAPVTYTRPGVAVELPCLTIATPRATVTWETPDLTQLRVMGQPRIYGNRYLSPQGSLVIQNPTGRDTGFYRCTAKNVIGVDTKATYLHVI